MPPTRQPRSKPKQARAEAMRARLVDTTAHLLATGTPVTTKAIAESAHVSIGTVYRYFSDRDEILDLLLQSAVREITNELAVSVGGALDLPVDQSVRAVVEALTTAFEKHAPILQAVGGPTGSNSDAAFSAEVERTLFPLARVIPARHRPDLSPEELDDLTFVTMGFTASGCLRIALQRSPTADREALIDTTARMLAAALTRPGRARARGASLRATPAP